LGVKAIKCLINPLPLSRTEFKKISEKYAKLYDSHYLFLLSLYAQTGVSCQGKAVLEIGGSCFPHELLFDHLKVRQWVSVEKLDWWGINRDKNFHEENNYRNTSVQIFPLNVVTDQYFEKYDHLLFNGDAADIPTNFENRFDVVCSSCAFEHIRDLKSVISKIFLCLKPGGIMYSYFGPIWSGCDGSHFWVDEKLNFSAKTNITHLPPYAHLLMDEPDMRKMLSNYHSSEIVEKIVYDIYHWDGINRLFCEDYELIMKESPFKNYKLLYRITPPISNIIRKELETRYPGYKKFQFRAMEIIGKKDA
jgi:SAM-dependent methyltransferase